MATGPVSQNPVRLQKPKHLVKCLWRRFMGVDGMPGTGNEEGLRTFARLRVKCGNYGDILIGRIGAVAAAKDQVVLAIDDVNRARKPGGGPYNAREGEKLAEGLGLFVFVLDGEDWGKSH